MSSRRSRKRIDEDADNMTASDDSQKEQEQPEDTPQDDSQKEEEEQPPQDPKHNPLNAPLPNNPTEMILMRLAQLMERSIQNQVALDRKIAEMNENVVKMSVNLVEGYKKTEQVLNETLTPIANLSKQVPTQPNPQQQYYQPPSSPQVPNSVQGVPANGALQLDPNIVMHLIDKMMATDQSANIFNQLGQRMFADMVTEQQYMRRAQWRQQQKAGWLTEQEANTAIANQDKMYGPLMGTVPNPQVQPNGKPAQISQ